MTFKFIFFLGLFFLYPFNAFSFAYPYEKMQIAKDIEKSYDSLAITEFTPLKNPDDRIFLDHYWKIYYQNHKIVGEELFVKGNLSYYYVYYYSGGKIYQTGFFWYGIYRDIAVFKAHNERIKQGWVYKDIPDSYRVFDEKTKKLTYEYYYPSEAG